MSAPAAFHFLRPAALLLLLAVPLFWLLWRSARTDAGAWRRAVDAHLLPHLIERVDGGPGRAGLALAALLWTLASVALAGPAWEREPMPLYRNQAARVLALELSPTMLAQDEKPNRLARARYKLDDILARSRDYQTALIGYAGDAFVAAPLTDDAGTVRNLVDALDPGTMPVAGNDTAKAIAAAADLIGQAGLHRGEVILLADAAGPGAAEAARKAAAQGVRVSVLGVGNAAGAPVPLAQGDFLKDDGGNVVISRVDEAGLRAVAEAGGGRFALLAPDGRDLDAVLGEHVEGAPRADAGEGGAVGNAESARWRDRGPWLLLLLAPLSLLGFRRGWLMALALAAAVPPRAATAASLADLWQRPDQQAAAALSRGDAKQAASVARSPDWRASASYRDGDYETAASEYAKAAGADGAYNRGNALARLGRYDEALKSYDEALKLAPGMADAKANRDAVEAFLKRRQDQNPPPQDGKDPQKKDARESQKDSGRDAPPQDQQKQDSPQDSSGDRQQESQQGSQPQDGRKPQDSGEQQGGEKRQDEQKDAQDQARDQNASAGGAGDEKQAPAPSEQKPDAAQQQALSRDIDKALADPSQPADKGGKPASGVAEQDDATREKKQALEHWLQRVPDDPGGLLRRKFQLEYQRRQHGGDDQ